MLIQAADSFLCVYCFCNKKQHKSGFGLFGFKKEKKKTLFIHAAGQCFLFVSLPSSSSQRFPIGEICNFAFYPRFSKLTKKMTSPSVKTNEHFMYCVIWICNMFVFYLHIFLTLSKNNFKTSNDDYLPHSCCYA